MRWVPPVLLGALALGSPATAQQRADADSIPLAEYQRVLVGLRDTVERLSARANELRRDLRSAGDPTVLSRGERLVQACRGTRDAFTATRPGIAGWRLPEKARAPRDSLVTAMRGLTERIDAECLRGLDPAGPGQRADTLRAWGPYRTSELDRSVMLYHGAAGRLARTLGINITRR
jgi:hypothetical protein